MFNKIWKEQIAKPKGKLVIWKPKSELKPREEEDRDCCQEAKDKTISFFKTMSGWDDFQYMKQAIQKQPCEKVRRWIDGVANPLKGEESDSQPLFKKILEEWDECEGR